jgi:hypothetical protein
MKNPDALRIFFPEYFGGKYKSLKKHNSRRIISSICKKGKKHWGFPTKVSDMARNMKMELHTFSPILYQSKKCGHRIHVLFMQALGAWISFPPPPFSLLSPLFSNFHINHSFFKIFIIIRFFFI